MGLKQTRRPFVVCSLNTEGVFEFHGGSGSETVRYELTEDDELLPVDQTPKAPYEIVDYRVECDCGETFWTWGDASEHVENEHLGDEIEISN